MQRVVFFLILFSINSILCFKHMVLIGPPGSGKGTFSQYLVKSYGYAHICPGDIFRQEINAKTELGKKIKLTLQKGEYVSDDIVCSLISENIVKAVGQNKYFVIDGFPRSVSMFEFLNNFFQDHRLADQVVFVELVACDQTCIDRISTRLFCPKCLDVYNSVSVNPVQFNKCDCCKIDLSIRIDDADEIVKRRLIHYHKQIEPLIDVIKAFYNIETIETENYIKELELAYDKIAK